MELVAFILFILVAAACAGIAEALVPGQVPGGFLMSALVGIIGAWVGASLFGHMGPDLAGIPLLPAIIGSALLIFGLKLIRRSTAHT
ncbi:MAG: GlsB/YeaQ/YmgE family stress response membrane protein [Candidatus Obscuribacterales bacterium]|nr:GlsB/YeaQ/YmgE family stress response membrane protein [Candidatus Obscuribacterales bacterium]